MSEVKVNKISPRTNCGTVQLGDSGDTITIPAGATITNNGTQTGFGRTGTVDWDTTAKTAGFTAVSGNGYFVNTTSGSITATLPATPSAGDIVAFKDYANTFDTNKLVLNRNGSNIDGVANNFEVTAEGQSITLVYIDATRGWVPTDAAKASDFSQQALFVTATGGTETTCGDFKIHTFTGPGTFCVSCAGNSVGSDKVDYLVIAGGGGGDNGGGAYGGGGAGAGGFRTTFPSPGCNAGAFPITATAFPITVGGGGSGGPSETSGSNSVFSTITSTGGGSGRTPGGSGGGAGKTNPNGTGNTPPVSPPQGNDGGSPAGLAGAGGGGAGAVGGAQQPSQNGGDGGAGSANSITGSSVTRAGGGGGGASTWACGSVPKDGGTGGPGGGGDGGNAVNSNPAPATINGLAGTANTGSGGGAGAWCSGGPGGPSPLNQNGTGGAGGSGIVIIRYKYQ